MVVVMRRRRRYQAHHHRRSVQRGISLLACCLLVSLGALLLLGGACLLLYRMMAFFAHRPPTLGTTTVSDHDLNASATPPVAGGRPCAINLYGLPRQFRDVVLPGLTRNVIDVNAPYRCDYFVHYHDKREESDYRGADQGRGGTLHPEEIRLLRSAVLEAHDLYGHRLSIRNDAPIVEFVKDTEESFHAQYDPLLQQIFNTRGEDGRLLYIPLSEKKPFPNATVVNIIKMFHSQQAVWNLMEPLDITAASSRFDQKHYSRVAMLRSDILYVTPIDIYQLPDGSFDQRNEYAVIPNFGNFPVNDRMIYGPSDAVRIWAAGRFSRLQRHAQRVHPEGHGIHPERFLHHTIFPAIRDAGVPIVPWSAPEEATMCFLRVRADRSIRVGDCGRDCETERNRRAVEHLLQRPCLWNRANPNVTFLECRDDEIALDDRRSSVGNALFPEVTWEGCPWKG